MPDDQFSKTKWLRLRDALALACRRLDRDNGCRPYFAVSFPDGDGDSDIPLMTGGVYNGRLGPIMGSGKQFAGGWQ
jgi:hypothetical protein